LADIDIQHLANLAQLELSQQEISVVGEDLQRIMIMVDQMQAIDTSNVEPLAHPLDARQRLRPDQITETIERDLYQQGAPATADGLYLVPRVVE
jgi:aspartyl-tRNA(Asn)/glutamyl-tRNA(Gln) amidotransferase subunit C